MESIPERLVRLRTEKGMSQGALAKAAQLSGQGAIGNIERGTRGYGKSAVDIARALGVTPDYLMCLTDNNDHDDAIAEIAIRNNPEYPSIRRVRFKLSAGANGFAVEYLDDDGEPIVFRRAWFQSRGYKPKHLFAVRVSNGSMETGLYHDDTVVVNTDKTSPKDGVVFAVNYEGELVIKRLVRDAGQWWLSSDNPDQRRYPRKLCDASVFLVGEIVHKQSERI